MEWGILKSGRSDPSLKEQDPTGRYSRRRSGSRNQGDRKALLQLRSHFGAPDVNNRGCEPAPSHALKLLVTDFVVVLSL